MFRHFKNNNDFDVERSGRSRAFKDEELQALVDEDPYQIQKQFAEALNCVQSVISDRLKALGKVYKEGKWVLYELKPRDIKRRKTSNEILLAKQKKGFLYRIVTGDEKWIYFDNAEKLFAIQANHRHRRQSGISTERRQCSVFDGIRRV